MYYPTPFCNPQIPPGYPANVSYTLAVNPPDFEKEPGPPVETDVSYLQGYLKQYIGRHVKIEFLIGTNMFVDKEGTLLEVGISYVVLQEPETDDRLVCDLYSIKFVTIFF